jgi:hypothetical protein
MSEAPAEPQKIEMAQQSEPAPQLESTPQFGPAPQFGPGQPFELDEPFDLTGDEPRDAEEPPRRSPVRRIVLLGLLVVALAGVGTLGYTGWQMNSQKDATLRTPDTIGNLSLDKSDDGQQTGDYLQTALSAEINLDQAVGAVYKDTSGHSVLFFGGTATIWSPESQLNNAFGLISDKQGAVTGLHNVDAGKLGGTMKCGTTKSDDGNLSVCGWADHGSLALAMFPNQPESAAAPLLREIRDATQTRS